MSPLQKPKASVPTPRIRRLSSRLSEAFEFDARAPPEEPGDPLAVSWAKRRRVRPVSLPDDADVGGSAVANPHAMRTADSTIVPPQGSKISIFRHRASSLERQPGLSKCNHQCQRVLQTKKMAARRNLSFTHMMAARSKVVPGQHDLSFLHLASTRRESCVHSSGSQYDVKHAA